MPIGILFWVLMVLLFICGGWGLWPSNPNGQRFQTGGGIILFVLLFLLGWGVFGFIVKG